MTESKPLHEIERDSLIERNTALRDRNFRLQIILGEINRSRSEAQKAIGKLYVKLDRANEKIKELEKNLADEKKMTAQRIKKIFDLEDTITEVLEMRDK